MFICVECFLYFAITFSMTLVHLCTCKPCNKKTIASIIKFSFLLLSYFWLPLEHFWSFLKIWIKCSLLRCFFFPRFHYIFWSSKILVSTSVKTSGYNLLIIFLWLNYVYEYHNLLIQDFCNITDTRNLNWKFNSLQCKYKQKSNEKKKIISLQSS